MFLSVRLNFRRPIYPGFYSFAKVFHTHREGSNGADAKTKETDNDYSRMPT